MHQSLTKLTALLHKEGIVKTAIHVFMYPFNKARHLHQSKKRKTFVDKVLNNPSVEERFTWIYQNNLWGSNESLSGTGSTLLYTENLRKQLPEIFSVLSIKCIFDAPCGDFNWMRKLIKNINISYIGGDIVSPLIKQHTEKYGSDNISFIHINLIKEDFPKADLMICRDCLFHLSYEDTFSLLNGFLRSEIPYLLTSTHKNMGQFQNHDIKTGDFRLIDLFSHPYNFPPDPLYTIADWLPPDPERYICLWTRDQIASIMNK